MLITITGAYKNAGDHLIGLRARRLLELYVDDEIVNIDRKSAIDYELLNSARAVVLTGGPALQPGIHPNVYDLDLDKIHVPVVGFGLGWKASLGKSPEEFEFTEQSLSFLGQLKTSLFSVRDDASFELLKNLGFENLMMTGCPAWYDPEKIDDDFKAPERVSSIVLTAPAVPNEQMVDLARLLSKRYPKAEKTILFQAGFRSTHSKKSVQYTKTLAWQRRFLRLLGWKAVSSESDVETMTKTLAAADLHVGYRVHSHLFMLSQRKLSVLIAEDARGESQNKTLGRPNLTTKSQVSEIIESIESFRTNQDEQNKLSSSMREHFLQMKKFLESLKSL